ncbi:hypothetical protein N8A98_02460 (plasmid) [Devosia neptuniae]|uniref:Histidine kinase-, DNA gyrase B-, and HSP90-like ATPase n=1 Tax=Devosia neptuniae TaxID=191302 RepID=A0ABY6C6U8_9HYPH|nr:hypothetical protein [Devosia neptuniae]UXN67936.1 hypothetical protein N8A98_02460 [Devosia neptuniae]
MRVLFERFLKAGTEAEVQAILDAEGLSTDSSRWRPYGDNEAFYGVVENQQAHPVPALVEKITNGIDAILEKKVVEEGIDVRSMNAPRSVQAALDRYFPDNRNWDLGDSRRRQAEDLQIVADGPRNDTSLLVYDNGIGQAPEDFARTFLSLLRGNKNDVHFVQGKYNMGGAGAIAFCGERRFQLVASKRYDGKHPLGFTLLRRHPPELAEAANKKNTWYEYLVFDGKVPVVDIDELDVGLQGRSFRTGSLLKLYSYRLPSGSRSIISRELNLSLDEFLFEPALPFLTVDTEERYPNNNALATVVYGLKRRLERYPEFIERKFSEVSVTPEFGEFRVSVVVFKARARGEGVKDTKQFIQREFFKNNMAVMFSLNGQVHGSYTSEFISRSLKMPLLKDYLLVQVDCTKLHLGVRNELFMASRDRLKDGDTADALRKQIRDILLAGELKDIAKKRKSSLEVDQGDAGAMLRDMTRSLPMNDALTRILRQSFSIPQDRQGTTREKPPEKREKSKKETRETAPFNPKRYPSAFHAKGGDTKEGAIKLYKLPMGGQRTISFGTDVENDYFDRSDDPGSLTLAVLRPGEGSNGGGGTPEPSRESENLSITRASPSDGTIRVGVRASAELKVGDTVELKATLSAPDGDLVETVLVRISDPEQKPPRIEPEPEALPGIPELVLCTRDGRGGTMTWESFGESGKEMGNETVVVPYVDEEKLSKIFVNLDSGVLRDFTAGAKSEEAIDVAKNRYISAVYFHTLFLFTTTRSRGYELVRGNGDSGVPVELDEYVSDLFGSAYAQFLLNFDTSSLIDALG